MKFHFALLALTLLSAAGCSHGTDIPVVPASSVKFDPSDGTPLVARSPIGTPLADLEKALGKPADRSNGNPIFTVVYYIAANTAPLKDQMPGVRDLRNDPQAAWNCSWLMDATTNRTAGWGQCRSAWNPNLH